MGDWQIETALGVLELDEKPCDEEFNSCIQAIQNEGDPRVALHSILLWTQAAVVPTLDSGIADVTLAALGTDQAALPPFRSVEARTLFLNSALPRAITSLLHRRKFYGHRYAAGNSNEEVSVEEEVLQLALQWLPRCVELVAKRPHLASDHLLEAMATLLEPGSTNSTWHPLYEAAHRMESQGKGLGSSWSASSNALQHGNNSGKSTAPSGGSWTDGPNGYAWYPDSRSSSHPPSGQVAGDGGGGVNPPWGQSAFGNTFPQTPPRRGEHCGRKGNVDGSGGGGGGGSCNSPMSVDENTHRCSPVDDLTDDMADKNNSTVDLTGAFDDDPDVHNYNAMGALGRKGGEIDQDHDDPELAAALKASMLDAHSSGNYEHSNDPGCSDDAQGELDSDALAALAAADAADVAESAQAMAELKHSAARAATTSESMLALPMPASAVGTEYETAGARMDATLEAAAAKAAGRFQHDAYPQGSFGNKSGTTHSHLSEKRRKKEKLSADSWQEMLQCIEHLWDRMQNGELELEDALDEASGYWIEGDDGSDVARAQQAVLEDELRLRVILLVSMGDDTTTTDSNSGEDEEDEDWGSDEGGTTEDAPANASRSGGITSKRGSSSTAVATRVATFQSSNYIDACKVARGGYSGPPLLYAAIVDAFGWSGGHLALASIISGHNSMISSFETSPRSMVLMHTNEKDKQEKETTIGRDRSEQEATYPIADAFRLRRVMELLQTVCRATVPNFAVQAATLCGQALLARFTANSATHATDVLTYQDTSALARRSSSDSSGEVGEGSNRSDSVSTWLRDSKKRAALDGAVEAWKTAAWAATAIQTNSYSSNSSNNNVAPSALLAPLSEQQCQDGESGNINNEDGIKKAPSFLEDQRAALLRLTVALPLERALLLLASSTLALRIAGLQDLRKCTVDAANEDQRAEDAAKNNAQLAGSRSLSGEPIESSSSSTSASSSTSSSMVSIDAGAANSSYFSAPRSPNSTVVEEAAAPSVHFSVDGDNAPPSPSSAELQAAIALSLVNDVEETPKTEASSNKNYGSISSPATGVVELPWQRSFVAARLSSFGLVECLLTPAYLHAELWQRCGDILAFLVQCNQLNEVHMQNLWSLVDPGGMSHSSNNNGRLSSGLNSSSSSSNSSGSRMSVGHVNDNGGNMGDYGRLHESVRHSIMKVLLQLVQTTSSHAENFSGCWSSSSDTTTTTVTTNGTNVIAKEANSGTPSPALRLPMLQELHRGMGSLQKRAFDSGSTADWLKRDSGSSTVPSSDYPMLELASSLADAALQQQRLKRLIGSNALTMASPSKASESLFDMNALIAGDIQELEDFEDDDDACVAALGVSLLWRACRDGSGASLTLHTKALELLLAKLALPDILMLPAGRWVLSKALCTLQTNAETTSCGNADLVLSLNSLSALLAPAYGALTYSFTSSTVQPHEVPTNDSGTGAESVSSSGAAMTTDAMRAHLVAKQVAPYLKPALKAYKTCASVAAAATFNGGNDQTHESHSSHTLNGNEILSGKYYGHLATVRAFRDILGLALAASAAVSAADPVHAMPVANMPDDARVKSFSQVGTGAEGMVELAWAALVDGALIPAEADEGYCFVAQIIDNPETNQSHRTPPTLAEGLLENEKSRPGVERLTRCWRLVLRLWQSSLVPCHNGEDTYTSPLITPMSLRLLLAALHFLHVADGSLCPVHRTPLPNSEPSSGSAMTATAVTAGAAGTDGATVSETTSAGEKPQQVIPQAPQPVPLGFTAPCAFDLEGANLLWNIVLGCVNEHVAAEASCALVTLCLYDANPPRNNTNTEGKTAAPLTHLVERCLDYLLTKNQPNLFEARGICRCLELLNLVMDAAEPRVEAAGISLPPPHDLTAARGELTTIAINGAFSTCPGLKSIKVRSRDSSWRLRQELLVQREALLPHPHSLAASAMLQDGLLRWTWGAFNFGAHSEANAHVASRGSASGRSLSPSLASPPSSASSVDGDEQGHKWPAALRVGYRSFKLMLLGNDVADERTPFADILGKNKAVLAMFSSQPPPMPAGCSDASLPFPRESNKNCSSNNDGVDMMDDAESTERTQVAFRGAAAAATLKVLSSGATFDLLLALLNQPGGGGSSHSQLHVAKKAWRLVMRLPTNDALSKALDISKPYNTERKQPMTSLPPTKRTKHGRSNLATNKETEEEGLAGASTEGRTRDTWSKVFDPSQPPKLLYTLRLVHDLFFESSFTNPASNKLPDNRKSSLSDVKTSGDSSSNKNNGSTTNATVTIEAPSTPPLKSHGGDSQADIWSSEVTGTSKITHFGLGARAGGCSLNFFKNIGKSTSTGNALRSADDNSRSNSSGVASSENVASFQSVTIEKSDAMKKDSIDSAGDRTRYAQLTSWASIRKQSKADVTGVDTSSATSISFSSQSSIKTTPLMGASSRAVSSSSSSPRLSAWCCHFVETGGLGDMVKCLSALQDPVAVEGNSMGVLSEDLLSPFRAACLALLVDMLSALINQCASTPMPNSGSDTAFASNGVGALSVTSGTNEDEMFPMQWHAMVRQDLCSNTNVCCQLLEIAQQVSTSGSNYSSLSAKDRDEFLVAVTASPCASSHCSSSCSNWLAEKALGAALALLSAAPELLLMSREVHMDDSQESISKNTDATVNSIVIDTSEICNKALAGPLRAALVAALLNAPATSTREATVHALKTIFAGQSLSTSTKQRIQIKSSCSGSDDGGSNTSGDAGRQAAAAALLHILVADLLPMVALSSEISTRDEANFPEPKTNGVFHGDSTEFLALLAELLGPGGDAPLNTAYASEILNDLTTNLLSPVGAAACFIQPEKSNDTSAGEGSVNSTNNAPALHAGALFVWIVRCVVSGTTHEACGSNASSKKALSDDMLGGLLDLLCKLLARLKAADPQWGSALAEAPLAFLSKSPLLSATTYLSRSRSVPTWTAQTLVAFLWQRCLFPDPNDMLSQDLTLVEAACVSPSFSRARALNLAKALAEGSSHAAALLLTLISKQLNTGPLPKCFFCNADMQLDQESGVGTVHVSVDSGINNGSHDEGRGAHQLLASVPSLDASSQSLLGRPDLSQQWQYDPLTEARNDARVQISNPGLGVGDRRNGYVGLVNLGATCYMNSFLQQVFMAPTLRNAILYATPQQEAPSLATMTDTAKSTSSTRCDDNSSSSNSSTTVLECVQEVLSILQESDKRSCDATRKLCAAYKNYANEPINPREQQDAEEFLNGLMDQMENTLRGSEHATILQKHLGGATTTQLVCQECGYVKARREPFFVLQLEVKGKASVEDSLRLFIEGEVLDGDNAVYCSRCAAKRPTLKRTALDANNGLPPNLFLHLKRFDFDLETFRKVKVNDRCSFPRVLDLAPFTLAHVETSENEDDDGNTNMKDNGNENEKGSSLVSDAVDERNATNTSLGLFDTTSKAARSHTLYDLAGVIVHSGTADSGHYYSYIRQRNSSSNASGADTNLSKAEESSWFCFNDTSVTPFDVSQLEAQCFGGRDEKRALGNSSLSSQLKSYSAYMLVYEQRCSSSRSPVATHTRSSPASLTSREMDPPGPKPPPLLPPHSLAIITRCRAENELLRRDQQLFDPRYASWLAAFLRQCADRNSASSNGAPNDSSSELLSAAAWQATACYVFDTAAHSRDKARFPSLVALLRNGLTAAPVPAATDETLNSTEGSTSEGAKKTAEVATSGAPATGMPIKSSSAHSASANQRALAGWFLEQLVGPRQWHRSLISCPQPLVRQAVAEIALLAFRAVLPAPATSSTTSTTTTDSISMASHTTPSRLSSSSAKSSQSSVPSEINAKFSAVYGLDHLAAIPWLHSDPNGADCVSRPPPFFASESAELPGVSASDQNEMRRSVEFLRLPPSPKQHQVSSEPAADGSLERGSKRMRSETVDDTNDVPLLLPSLLPPPPLPRLRWWQSQSAPAEGSPFASSSSSDHHSSNSNTYREAGNNATTDHAPVPSLSNAESTTAVTTAAATAAATALGSLLELCAELPASVGGCWQRGRELLNLLADVAGFGPAACVLLVRVGAVPRLVDLLMGPHSDLVPLKALSLEAVDTTAQARRPSSLSSSFSGVESTVKASSGADAIDDVAHANEMADAGGRRPLEHPRKTTSPRSGEPQPGPLDCLPLARCLKSLLQHLAPPPSFLAADAPWRLQCSGDVAGANALRLHRRDVRRSLKVDSSLAGDTSSKAKGLVSGAGMATATAAVPMTINVDDDDDDDVEEASAVLLGNNDKAEAEDPTAELFETANGTCNSLSGVGNLHTDSQGWASITGSANTDEYPPTAASVVDVATVGVMSHGWGAEPVVANVAQCRPPEASLLVAPSVLLVRRDTTTTNPASTTAAAESLNTTTKRKTKQAARNNPKQPTNSAQSSITSPKAEDEEGHGGLLACFPLDDWQLLLREGLVLSKFAAAAQLESSSAASKDGVTTSPPLTSELRGIVQLLAYGSPLVSARLVALCGHKLARLPESPNSSTSTSPSPNNNSNVTRTLGVFRPSNSASSIQGGSSSPTAPWKHMLAALVQINHRDGLQQWRATQVTRELLAVARLGAHLPNAAEDGWTCGAACREAILASSRQAFRTPVVYANTPELWGTGKKAPPGLAVEALGVLADVLKEGSEGHQQQQQQSALGVYSNACMTAACVRNALLARPVDWSVLLWACPRIEDQLAASRLAEALALNSAAIAITTSGERATTGAEVVVKASSKQGSNPPSDAVVDLSSNNSDAEGAQGANGDVDGKTADEKVADGNKAASTKRVKLSEGGDSIGNGKSSIPPSSDKKRRAELEGDSSTPKKVPNTAANEGTTLPLPITTAVAGRLSLAELSTLESEVENAYSALVLLRAVLPAVCAGLDSGGSGDTRDSGILLLDSSSNSCSDGSGSDGHSSSCSGGGGGGGKDVISELQSTIPSGYPLHIDPRLMPARGLEHRSLLHSFGSVSGTTCAVSEASCIALWAVVSHLPETWKDAHRSTTRDEVAESGCGEESDNFMATPASASPQVPPVHKSKSGTAMDELSHPHLDTEAAGPAASSSSREKELLARADWIKHQGRALLAAWTPPLLAMLIHQNNAANGLGGNNASSNNDPRQRLLLKTVHALTQGWSQSVARSLATAAIADPSTAVASASSPSTPNTNDQESTPFAPLPEDCLASKLFLYQLHFHPHNQACSACHESTTPHLYGILQDLCNSNGRGSDSDSSYSYRTNNSDSITSTTTSTSECSNNNNDTSGARLAAAWSAHSNWKWCQRTFVLGNCNAKNQLAKETLTAICAKYQNTAQAILSLSASLLHHPDPTVACAACQAAVSMYVLELYKPQRVESLPISSGGVQGTQQLAATMRIILQGGRHFNNYRNVESRSADSDWATAELRNESIAALVKAFVDDNIFGAVVRLLKQAAATTATAAAAEAAAAAAAAATKAALDTSLAPDKAEAIPLQGENEEVTTADAKPAAQPAATTAAAAAGEGGGDVATTIVTATPNAGKAKSMMKNWLSVKPKAKKAQAPAVEVLDGTDDVKAAATTIKKEVPAVPVPAPAAATSVAKDKGKNAAVRLHDRSKGNTVESDENWQLCSALLDLVLGLAPVAAAATTSAASAAAAAVDGGPLNVDVTGIAGLRASDPIALALALKALKEPSSCYSPSTSSGVNDNDVTASMQSEGARRSSLPNLPSTLHPGAGLGIDRDSPMEAPIVKKRKKQKRDEASAAVASGAHEHSGSSIRHADWVRARDELGVTLLTLMEAFFLHTEASATTSSKGVPFLGAAPQEDRHSKEFDRQAALALQLCFSGDPILTQDGRELSEQDALSASGVSSQGVTPSLLMEVLARAAGLKSGISTSQDDGAIEEETDASMDANTGENERLDSSLPSSSSSSGWQLAVSTSGPMADVIFSAWRCGLATQFASSFMLSGGGAQFTSAAAAQSLVDAGLAAATVALSSPGASSSVCAHAAVMTHLAALAASDTPPALFTAIAASPSLPAFLLSLASSPVYSATVYENSGMSRIRMAICRAAVVIHLLNGDTWSALRVEEKRSISDAVADRSLALAALAEGHEAAPEAAEAAAMGREAAHWASFCRGVQLQAPDGSPEVERVWL